MFFFLTLDLTLKLLHFSCFYRLFIQFTQCFTIPNYFYHFKPYLYNFNSIPLPSSVSRHQHLFFLYSQIFAAHHHALSPSLHLLTYAVLLGCHSSPQSLPPFTLRLPPIHQHLFNLPQPLQSPQLPSTVLSAPTQTYIFSFST